MSTSCSQKSGMGSYTEALFSVNTSQKASNYDEISMQQSLHFADGLKDLKNLRKQLYSAAEYFETSYVKDGHKQLVMESSKDYVAKALVSAVDHLGSVADKLNRFLDEKSDEFSATKIRFSSIEQRLNTYNGFIGLRGISQHSLMLEAPKHQKRYIFPGAVTLHFGKSNLMYENCIPCPECDMHQTNQDNPFAKAFQARKLKSQHTSRKANSRISLTGSSPIPVNFSFTRMMSNKEAGKHSVSPLQFPLKRSGSVTNRSISPRPAENKHRSPSEPRRAISVYRIPEMANREREIVTYTKRSKHLFKSLLNIHRSRKDVNKQDDRL